MKRMATEVAAGEGGRSSEASMALRLSPTPEGAIAPARSLSSRYELMGKLSTGGMATLHIARLVGIPEFEKIVVLKRILPSRADDTDYLRMFDDEARVAATLEHPNIVHTHDIGHDDDGAFFTMEYLHGENVKRIISATRKAGEMLPFELALQIAIGCAAGLHHAHDHRDYTGEPLGIVHRDVSPSNILVTYQSGVKLIDFGIAKAASGNHVTGVGVVKGKASYMSPEQCRGEAVDRRSDVFSLGIVLYEMTTMTRPFEAPDQIVVLAKILRDDPVPPSKLRPDYPPALERVVMRALARDPAERYASAFEMQEDLELVTRECKLHALPGALGRYLEHLFGAKPYPWAKFYRRQPPPPPPMRSGLLEVAATAPRQRIDSPTAAREFDPNEMTTEPSRIATGATSHPDPVAAPLGSIYAHTRASESSSQTFAAEPPRPLVTGTRIIAVSLAIAALAVLWIVVAPTRTPSSTTSPLPGAEASAVAAPTLELRTAAVTPTVAPSPSPALAESSAIAEPSALAEAAPIDDLPIVETTPPESSRAPSKSTAADRATRVKEAKRLVEESRRVVFSDAKRAVGMARKAVAMHATQDGYAMLGLAGCKSGDARAARTAFKNLQGSKRDDLVRTCATRGIKL
jgi:serine/threonine protein kinase